MSRLIGLSFAAGLLVVTDVLTAAGLPYSFDDTALRTKPLYVLYLENDSVAGTDGHYTNGLKLSRFSAEKSEWSEFGWLGDIAESTPVLNRIGGHKSIGLALGQNIYTPQDTSRIVPDPSDRPYAGWTYFEIDFARRSRGTLDTLSLQLGIVGPHSYGEDVQRYVHARLGSADPKGWDHQLRDEPAVNLVFERKGRITRRLTERLLRFDFVPHVGASVGNVYTYANVGATGRLGINSPIDFGVDPIGGGGGLGAVDGADARTQPHGACSFFLFGGVDARAYARNIFLDGNTFVDSPSVTKRPFVTDVYFGAGAAWGRWQITYAYVERSREFEGQKEPNRFGSLTVFCSW